MEKPSEVFYLSDTDISKIYGVSRQTVWRWNKEDLSFPKPIKLSGGCTRWYRKDLEQWESNKSINTVDIKQTSNDLKDNNKTNDIKSAKLKGLWFHSFDENNEMVWQGNILQEVKSGYFLVQLYEWAMGEASIKKLVSIENMQNWTFYESNEKMIEACSVHNANKKH